MRTLLVILLGLALAGSGATGACAQGGRPHTCCCLTFNGQQCCATTERPCGSVIPGCFCQ